MSSNARWTIHLSMKPEWNPTQTVRIKDRTVSVAASPYDVPESFSMESDGSKVTITPIYDFSPREQMDLAVLPSDKVRIFLGQKSGRVMRVEIDVRSRGDTVQALRETADLLRSLADKAEREPIRRSVHLGMLEQALPMMGPAIEQSLKELRNHTL